MTREEYREAIWDAIRNMESDEDSNISMDILAMALRLDEIFDMTFKYIHKRMNHWDAPCSGDETVRNELNQIQWFMIKRIKDAEKDDATKRADMLNDFQITSERHGYDVAGYEWDEDAKMFTVMMIPIWEDRKK